MNVIGTMHAVFSLFSDDKEIYDGYCLSKDIENACHIIQSASVTDKSEFDFYPLLVADVMIEGESHFIIYDSFNSKLSFSDLEALDELELNNALFSIALSCFKERIQPIITTDQINQYIFYLRRDISLREQNYTGHDHTELKKYFKEIYVLKNNNNIDINQLVIELCFNNTQLSQNISSDLTLTLIQELQQLAPILPVKNLAKALFHQKPENTFLELYKLIERMYSIPYISNLHSSINDNSTNNQNIDFWSLYKGVKKTLNWNHQEKKAFINLVDILEDESRLEIKQKLAEKIPEFNVENCNIANFLYDIRCRIVHEGFFHEHVSFTKQQWEYIYQATLILIKKLYQKYSSHLANYYANQ